MKYFMLGLLTFLLACENEKFNADQGGVIEEDFDGDGLIGDADCDPYNADVNGLADELCDGIDNDCDGDIDEDPIEAPTWYSDSDSDGFGNESNTVQACEQPSGYTDIVGDCDDFNSSIHPNAGEYCDGYDNDCDSLIDDDDPDLDPSEQSLWAKDLDADGFGDPENTVSACMQPDGYVDNFDDCDDSDINTYLGAAEEEDPNACMTDSDGDGFGDANPDLPGIQAGTDCDDSDPNTYLGAAYNDDPTICATDADGDGFGYWFPSTQDVQAGSDCDDGNAQVNVNALEVCGDNIDNDCDGLVDDDSSSDALIWYTDSDGDGYGNPNSSAMACVQPPGMVADNTDCDDSSATTYPGAASEDPSSCMSDADGDGYGDSSPSVPGVQAGTDCDDSSSTTHPDAAELELLGLCTEDADDDGYANSTPSVPGVQVGSDCEDNSSISNPNGLEVCGDGLDNDCNGSIDDGLSTDAVTWYADSDNDGYGDINTTLLSCDQPSGYVSDNTDCDDSSDTTYPGAASEDLTACMSDSDGDGYGDASPTLPGVQAGTDCNDNNNLISPVAPDTCDGIDNDCDGIPDDPAPLDAPIWYADTDGDGFGDINSTLQSCEQPSGYVSDNTDCDDSSDTTYPGAAWDEDPLACMSDSDGDGYGDASPSIPGVQAGTDCDDGDGMAFYGAAYNEAPSSCMQDSDGDGYGNQNPSNPNIDSGSDCDDSNSNCYPGAAEDESNSACMQDNDQDGYGDSTPSDPNVQSGTDCDDSLDSTNPAAIEICDNIDNDCDGQVDEDGVSNGSTWYADNDGDGFGDPNTPLLQCGQPSGYVIDSSDCDDNNSQCYPGAAENDSNSTCMQDNDQDGYGDSTPSDPNVQPGTDCDDNNSECYVGAAENDSNSLCMSDNDGDGYGDQYPADPGVQPGSDCDDSNNDCFPGAAENDSNSTCMQDNDQDGYGDSTPPSSNIPPGTDCNDGDNSISPAAIEICDNIDNDCDTLIDEAGSQGGTDWYADDDNDGYGNPNDSISDCYPPPGYTSDGSDCDDSNSFCHPGAAENDSPSDCMEDNDDDGFGNSNPSNGAVPGTDCDDSDSYSYPGAAFAESSSSCMSDSDGDGYGDSTPNNNGVDAGTDCNDTNPDISPIAVEVCDGLDNDCNGYVDNTDPALDLSTQDTFYIDADGDGYGDISISTSSCNQPFGYVSNSDDCDDDPSTGIYAAPDVAETCDFVDNDCDGLIDLPGTVAFFPTGSSNASDLTAEFTGTPNQPATPILSDSGTVVLCEGQYYVNMTVQDDILLSPNGSVVLDGADTGTIVTINQSGVDFEASDIIFYQGSGSNSLIQSYTNTGGGIYCFGYSNIVLSNVEFSLNTADLGGAIFSYGCSLTVSDSTFSSNDSEYGGGIYAGDGDITLTNVLFDDNFASTVGGAAVMGSNISATTLTANDLTFTNNESPFGGALNVQQMTTIINDSTFEGNTGSLGGGLNVLGGDFTGQSLTFLNNSASLYGGAAAIGAELSSESTVSTIIDSDFIDNTAPNGGAIMYLEGQNTLQDSYLANNTAQAFGGALFVGDQYDDTFSYTDLHLNIEDSLIEDNIATYGSGMYLRFEATASCIGDPNNQSGFISNIASQPTTYGAVHLTNDVSFSGESCDMGSGTATNLPNDISIELSNSIGAYNYSDDATFVCDGTGCTP